MVSAAKAGVAMSGTSRRDASPAMLDIFGKGFVILNFLNLRELI